MKILVYIAIVHLSISIVYAQAPPVQWSVSLGGDKAEHATAVEQTRDKGYIVCGFASSNNGDVTVNKGGSDGWLVKLNIVGQVEWQKTYGGSLSDGFSSVRQTKDGGFIILGQSESSDGDLGRNQGSYDYWILKTDSLGNISWSKTYGGSEREYGRCIRETSEGGFIVAGTAYSKDGDVSDHLGWEKFWTLKLDIKGNIEWCKTYGGSRNEGGLAIDLCKDGGYIMTGFSSSGDGDLTQHFGESDLWIVKINQAGSIEWQKSYGYGAYEAGRSIQQTLDGGYIIAGEIYFEGYWDYWIIKTNASGAMEWDKKMGGTGTDHAFTVTQTIDKGYIISGIGGGSARDINDSKGGGDAWTIKLNEKGGLEWKKSFGGSSSDRMHCVRQTQDEGFVLVGSSSSNDMDLVSNKGDYDFWILKILPEPLVISGPREFCEKQSKTFKTNKFPLKFNWHADTQSARLKDSFNFISQKSGKYTITAFYDTFGILFTDTFVVNILPEPRSLLPEILKACEPMREYICPQLNQSGLSIIWNDGILDSCRIFENSAVHSVKMSNKYCSSFDTIQVIEKPSPKFNVFQSDTPCLDGIAYSTLYIAPDTFPNVQWQTGIPGNSHFINYSESIKYVRVTGSNSCFTNQQYLPTDGCGMTWYLPDAFTPNNDGHNDMLKVSGSHIASAFIEVYNRWGELVFRGEDATTGWDGRYEGNIVPEAYYYVIIRLKSDKNSEGNSPIVYFNAMVLLMK